MDVAVLPKTFAIPDWVALGLADGELRIFGGVVRNAAGQIVLHLKDAGMAKEAARAAAKAARKAVDAGAGKGKLIAMGIVAAVAVGATVGAIYHYRKRGSTAEVDIADPVIGSIDVFQQSALEYSRALQSGRLSRTTLSNLQTAVDRLHESLNQAEQANLSVLQARAQIENARTFCKMVSNLTSEVMAKDGSAHTQPLPPQSNDLIQHLEYLSLLLDWQSRLLFPKAA